MEFNDQVVWITGASSGIGRALAHEFARHGAKLVLSSRNQKSLRTLVAELKLPAERVLVLPLDLARYRGLSKKVPAVLKKFGRIDILVNNAGISQRSLAHETKLSVFEKLMAVNYFGTVALTLAVLPHFRMRKVGTIVVVSSVAGCFGTPLRSGYSASKFALAGFFEALRAENWRENLRVVMVFPGFIRTAISYNALTATGKPQGKMDRAQEQGMAPERCAQVIVRGIARGRNTIFVGGLRERLALWVSRHFPALFAHIIRRARVT